MLYDRRLVLAARSRREEVFGAAVIAALVAFALAFGAQRGRRAVPVASRAGEVTELGGAIAHFALFPTSGRVEVKSTETGSRYDLELSLVVDGVERPLVMRRSDVQLRDKGTLAASFPIEIGEERAAGAFELKMDPASDQLTVGLVVTPEPGSSAHTYALRFGMSPQGRSIFIPGTGSVSDVAATSSASVIVDDESHPLAIVSSQAKDSLSIIAAQPEAEVPGAQSRLIITAKTETAAERAAGAAPKPARLETSLLLGANSQKLWGRLYKLLRVPVAKVSGVVTGTKEHAHVFALDEEGHPQVRASATAEGKFLVEAPMTAVQWYAALDAAQTSAPVRFTPGTPWDVRLDVSAGGEVHIHAFDADNPSATLPVRLNVKGIEGTLDPSFGPDYRASGAGPLMDLLDGDVTTPLPSGKYRISASHGMEWSIDAENVEIVSGHGRNVELALRHVIPSTGILGCDLHVHARPSFDTPVTMEDRVLSLVAAGVDFAVPTEHNVVGDYSPAIDLFKVGKIFSSVTGVEVTTYNPRFGHFGVFPYPTGQGVPPFKGTTAAALFSGGHRGDPSRIVQVNHPRLPMGIGYFQIVGFDPKQGRLPSNLRTDFDTLEVYNGYDIANRARVDQVVVDWFALLNLGKRYPATGSSDSHRIQYQWAGYPRTFVQLDPRAAGDGGGTMDVPAIIAALKKGRSYVSSGPAVEIELTAPDGRTVRIGDEVALPRGPLTGHLKVRAPAWIDVSTIEVIVGVPATPAVPPAPQPAGTTVTVFKNVPAAKPMKMGKEEGTLEEAQARTLRLDTDLSLTIPDGARWLVVMVRGERPMDDALPFMPVQPLAFTNPIWLTR